MEKHYLQRSSERAKNEEDGQQIQTFPCTMLEDEEFQYTVVQPITNPRTSIQKATLNSASLGWLMQVQVLVIGKNEHETELRHWLWHAMYTSNICTWAVSKPVEVDESHELNKATWSAKND